jgi:hypothetical protein
MFTVKSSGCGKGRGRTENPRVGGSIPSLGTLSFSELRESRRFLHFPPCDAACETGGALLPGFATISRFYEHFDRCRRESLFDDRMLRLPVALINNGRYVAS